MSARGAATFRPCSTSGLAPDKIRVRLSAKGEGKKNFVTLALSGTMDRVYGTFR